MKQCKLLYLITLATLMAVLGAAFPATAAQAAPATAQVAQEDGGASLTGTVAAVDETGGTLTVEVVGDDGTTTLVTVQAPEDFDFGAVAVGDAVTVTGTAGEDDTFIADEVQLSDPDEDDLEDKDDLDETDGINYFCANPDATHPVGGALATVYDVTYAEVMGWFCDDGMGFGQIMLALQTSAVTEDTPDTYLTRRIAGEGWGTIWQDLGLIGRGRKAADVDDVDDVDIEGKIAPVGSGGPPEGVGRPENVGPPDHANNGSGGPPEGVGRPENVGPPDHANNGSGGPPEGVGRPENPGASRGRGKP